jgi:hypothetical protein
VDDTALTTLPPETLRMVPMAAYSAVMSANTEIPLGTLDITYKTVVTFSML